MYCIALGIRLLSSSNTLIESCDFQSFEKIKELLTGI